MFGFISDLFNKQDDGSRAKFILGENVEYELRDEFGNIKPLFQENDYFRQLLKEGKAPMYSPVEGVHGYFAPKKKVHNLVTSAGKAAVAGLINGVVTNFFEYIAVGTGTTAAAAGDTALEAEISDSGLSRVSATTSRVTTDVTNDTAQLTTTFTVTGTKAVTESGVLDSASTGTLLARQVFSAINVVNGDSLTITWKFDID